MGRLVARECMQCLIQIDEKRKRGSSTWALFFSPLFELPWSYDTWAGCLVTRCGGIRVMSDSMHNLVTSLHHPVPHTSTNLVLYLVECVFSKTRHLTSRSPKVCSHLVWIESETPGWFPPLIVHLYDLLIRPPSGTNAQRQCET